ncbi:MAG TPA: shikimate dehydrogenase [Hyphomicrobiaceae bacterium]|nr:shikimate dehydrogenase [Hyphomicrobiaceae bacterium]
MSTRHACIVGWPVEHSRSPMIHNFWLEKHAIDGSYTRRAVPPGEEAGFFAALRNEGLAGCNVTLPHKQAALAAAEVATDDARAVGVANTLWLEDGRLHADNTDGAGFVQHLQASVPAFAPARAAVSILGAGGGARGVIHALLRAGVPEVRLFNRTRDRADAVARHFGARVRAHDWGERQDRSRDAGLLINATSLGMRGSGDLDMPLAQLADDCVVADLVYVPLETPLLAAARARGLPAVDGLGMLLHQAVPGFQRWFGIRPEVTPELRALLVADIEKR